MPRPDIANAILSVAHRTHGANQKDWGALAKVLRYLRGTKNLGLKLTEVGRELVACTNPNYATEHEDRKSNKGGDHVYG